MFLNSVSFNFLKDASPSKMHVFSGSQWKPARLLQNCRKNVHRNWFKLKCIIPGQFIYISLNKKSSTVLCLIVQIKHLPRHVK